MGDATAAWTALASFRSDVWFEGQKRTQQGSSSAQPKAMADFGLDGATIRAKFRDAPSRLKASTRTVCVWKRICSFRLAAKK